MSIEGYIIFYKWLKVSTVFKHVLNNILAMVEVVATVTFELITECTEQTVPVLNRQTQNGESSENRRR